MVGLGMRSYAANNLGVGRLAEERMMHGAKVSNKITTSVESQYNFVSNLDPLPAQYSFLKVDWKVRNFVNNDYTCKGDIYDIPMRICGGERKI